MKLRRLGNNGSGIVTVVICVMLIMILGSALLFTAYSGFQIKVSQRRSTENFYDAETAMSQVRAGVQQIVTESIAAAYTDVLTSYNVSDDIETAFHTSFKDALLAWKTADGNAFSPVVGEDGVTLTNAWRYNPEVLESFITDSAATLDFVPNTYVTAMGDVVVGEDSIVLKGLSVNYVKNGYETKVSTDISINMPGFTYVMSEQALNGIPEFALIARTALTQTANTDLKIVGNAYAGRVSLDVSGILKISSGTLISAGDVSVEQPGNGVVDGVSDRLILEKSATLWANRIKVSGDKTKISLQGDVYVADDLELDGTNTGAVLSGRYYGFGLLADSTTDYTTSTSGESSSIIINGKNTTLDLHGLNTLMLAGQSFIKDTKILMGQSISVKSDQLAYLAPAELLSVTSAFYERDPDNPEGPDRFVASGVVTGANPYIFTGNHLGCVLDESKEILPGKKLSYYGASVQPVTSNLSSTGDGDVKIAYFYLVFPTKDKANEYFRDYFTSNSDAIEQYMEVYSDALAAATSLQTSGNTYGSYGTVGDGDLSLIAPVNPGTLTTATGRLSTMYGNLCSTLSANVPTSGTGIDPYIYTIRTGDIGTYLPANAETPFRDEDNNVVGLIVTNESGEAFSFDVNSSRFTGDGEYANVRVIIATGDVKVSTDFRGLIIAGGEVSLMASLNADASAVVDALNATANIGTEETPMVVELSSFTILGTRIVPGGSADDPTADFSGSWDTDALVSYSGWRKN